MNGDVSWGLLLAAASTVSAADCGSVILAGLARRQPLSLHDWKGQIHGLVGSAVSAGRIDPVLLAGKSWALLIVTWLEKSPLMISSGFHEFGRPIAAVEARTSHSTAIIDNRPKKPALASRKPSRAPVSVASTR